jgi:hypothetical protein
MLYPKKGLDAASAPYRWEPFITATVDYIRVFYASILLDVLSGITRQLGQFQFRRPKRDSYEFLLDALRNANDRLIALFPLV